MSSYTTLSNLATEIWIDIGSPSSISTSSIETKLISSGYLGSLDIILNSSHYIGYDYINSGYCFEADLSSQEQAIYKQKYLMDYYLKRSTEVLLFSNGQTADSWTTMRDGDSTIVRSNPVDISKFFLNSHKDARKLLDDLVTAYKMNASGPLNVDYYTIENPTTKSTENR